MTTDLLDRPVAAAETPARSPGSQRPAFITFTGLDAQTNLDRVVRLSERYPIEWGILFYPKKQGDEPIYPVLHEAVRIALTLKQRGVRLAAHLCGGHSKHIIEKTVCRALEAFTPGTFTRIQVNTAGVQLHPAADDIEVILSRVSAYAEDQRAAAAILQCQNEFPVVDTVNWLQDGSAGKGMTPDAWLPSRVPSRLVGFAGGLGPDNIEAELPNILKGLHPATPYWVDMQSHIRTDDLLDLDKCEAVCRAVYDNSMVHVAETVQAPGEPDPKPVEQEAAPRPIAMGYKVRSRQSGLVGFVTGIEYHLTGTVHFLVQPYTPDARRVETAWGCDGTDLNFVDEGVAHTVQPLDAYTIKLGQKVKDRVNKAKGIVTRIIEQIDGCVLAVVELRVNKVRALNQRVVMVDHKRLKVVGPGVSEDASKPLRSTPTGCHAEMHVREAFERT